MGLSIARYLTELHDGTLTVSSESGRKALNAEADGVGSIFVLTLPSSSFDLIDSEDHDERSSTSSADSESLWPQIVSPASDTALTR